MSGIRFIPAAVFRQLDNGRLFKASLRRAAIASAAILSTLFAAAAPTTGQDSTSPPAVAERPAVADSARKAPRPPSAPLPQAEQLSELLTTLLRNAMPREYENAKKWGLTREAYAGVRLTRGDDGNFTTHRRWRTVNHGLWKMYRVTMDDPESQLTLSIADIREVAPGRMSFELTATATVAIVARVTRWNGGLRLFSLCGVADATVRLRMRCEVGAELDLTRIPPEIVLSPIVQDAEIQLLRFELQRLSDIRGGAAHQLGKHVRDLAEEELQDQRPRLIKKINEKIAKSEDKLRLSLKSLVPQGLLKAAEAARVEAPVPGPKPLPE